jgi:phosphatidate cytidylyltransferase
MADPADHDASSSPAPAGGLMARVGKDLVPRFGSAVVLAAAVAGLTWLGGVAFAAMLLGVCGIVAWEWSRIIRGGVFDVAMIVHIGVVALAIGLATYGLIGLAVLALVIGAILLNLLTVGRHPGLSALGVPYAGLPAVALIWLRGDEPWGVWAVGFLVLAVAATDVGAYFAGRLIGGPKLWPRVSPNKTWAGLIGAMATSAVVAALFAQFVIGAHAGKLAALAVILALVAQAGDLGESMLKRRFGAKDASNIIPGHGGFMDRVDGLVTAAVFAALVAAALDMRAPAKALLLW